jgi:hypothetical protein
LLTLLGKGLWRDFEFRHEFKDILEGGCRA